MLANSYNMSENNSLESPLQYAKKIRTSVSKKANENKNTATFLFLVILFSTVLSPVLILVSDNAIVSKYLPAGLTACAALASYWLQLRKPQERWVLYRTAQREVEFEIDQYIHGVGKYDTEEKDKILADHVSQRALQLHYQWMPIVPRADDINKLLNEKNAKV